MVKQALPSDSSIWKQEDLFFFELKFVLKNKVENSGKSWAQALMSRKK